MKNVTVTMEDSVADWARMEAARRNMIHVRLNNGTLQYPIKAAHGEPLGIQSQSSPLASNERAKYALSARPSFAHLFADSDFGRPLD